jgi:DNA repair exonuclease SbcCD ATPase subunit
MTKPYRLAVSLVVAAQLLMPATAMASEGSFWQLRAGIRDAFRDKREDARDDFKERKTSAAAEFKDKRMDARDDFKERKASAAAEFKERLSERRKEHIKQWWARVNRRLSAVIERLYKLADKIDGRLDRAEAAGKDVSEQRDDLTEARAKIDAAKQKLADATAEVESIIADGTPREAFAKLRELHKGVISSIREAHRALVAVLVSLRDLVGTPTPSVTSTP